MKGNNVTKASKVMAVGGSGALLVACLLGGCSGGGASGSTAPAAQPLPVVVETVRPRAVEESSEYVGMLVSRESVAIHPRVSGYVREILVTPGQKVKAGTGLLRIDARQEAAALAQSSASLQQAETQLQLASQTRARVESLHREGIRSRQDFDAAVAEERAARANVQAARANRRARSVQVGFHEVMAPFAGRVGDILVRIGDAVDPQTVLTQVDQSDELEIAVQVPVERAGLARVGQTPLEVVGDDNEPLLRSPVFFIAPRPEAATQLVELRGRFDNPGTLRSGQRVRVRVIWRTLQALSVPTYAVTRQSGQAFVFAVAQSKAQRRPVTLGMISGDRWTVTKGLKEGDTIATTRLQALRDGQPVKPQTAPAVGEAVTDAPAGRANQAPTGQPGPGTQPSEGPAHQAGPEPGRR